MFHFFHLSLADKPVSVFVTNFPLVLSQDTLSKEVPYLGRAKEVEFYVEGLRFPDKDFDGLITINLSLLEPISDVRMPTYIPTYNFTYFCSNYFLMLNFYSHNKNCLTLNCKVSLKTSSCDNETNLYKG